MIEDIEVNGLVVRETKTGEADKIVTLFTDKLGLITVSGKGASSLKSKYASSTQVFTYNTFLLRKKGSFYYIRDAFFLENFMNIRYDIEKLALANYICDVVCELGQEDAENRPLLSLTLNTLYALANRDLPLPLIRAAFEFRAAVQEGFMPDLSVCGRCGGQIVGESVIDVMNGHLLCKKCHSVVRGDPALMGSTTDAKIFIRITPTVLAALRYIESASMKKYLSFSIGSDELPLFSLVCEKYLLNHVEHGFSSLEYYKKITAN